MRLGTQAVGAVKALRQYTLFSSVPVNGEDVTAAASEKDSDTHGWLTERSVVMTIQIGEIMSVAWREASSSTETLRAVAAMEGTGSRLRMFRMNRR